MVAPDQTATVTGHVVAPPGTTLRDPTVRALKSRRSIANRSDVDAWAATTGAANGTEIARITTPATLAPGQSLPVTLVLPADSLRLPRAYGVIPVALEVLDSSGAVLDTARTFVGWHRAIDYTPLSLAWVVPLTLDPDPELSSPTAATRAEAWRQRVGPGSRLERLVRATSPARVAWAIDPAVFGRDPLSAAGPPATDPSGPASSTLDPVAAVTGPFLEQMRQEAARHTVLALPYADPDLAAASGGPLVQRLVARQADLSSLLGPSVRTGVAWPADGALPPGREAAFQGAYQQRLTAILASTSLTTPSMSLTPTAPAAGARGTPVVRWDDRLSQIVGESRGSSPGLVTQQFVAQTVALLGERPWVARTFVVAPARGLDPDPDALAGLLTAVSSLPWVDTVDVNQALTEATSGGKPTVEQLAAPPATEPSPLTPTLLQSLERQRGVIDTVSRTLVDSTGFALQWQDTVDQLTSVRWRKNPVGHAQLYAQTLDATGAVSEGLSVMEQTTNFLADEGTLQVTIVNELDGAVDGIRLNLEPTSPRLRVVQEPDPVRIEGNSKATVPVRVAAVAAGLVPVKASLLTAAGDPIGQPATLTVRAAPPGAWAYVVGGSVVGLVLLVGIIRSLRRPPRSGPALSSLDLVDPVSERPVRRPVVRPQRGQPPDTS